MKRRVAYHIAFWLAFWFIYAYMYSRYDGNLSKYLFTEGLEMPARMLATYLSFWSFERFSGGQKTWLAFGGAAMASIIGGLLNRMLKLYYLVPVHFPDATIDFWSYRLMYDVFDCVLASCTALSARMYFRQQAMQLRENQLRAEKSEAELKALKGQLHPHFLFNTINNLYALARVKSSKTAPVALKLAQLLRYVLYESQHPVVPLEQEIRLLEDYIELEKLRFDDDRLQVVCNVSLDQPRLEIAPLLLLPLVENAFKHGASEQRTAAFVFLDIRQHDRRLEVVVRNSLPEEKTEKPAGIGLQNLRRQLELLYPRAHELSIRESKTEFEAVMTLQIP
ncbi:MAG: histidine kinase [Saprospiraceae bacterium]|nr:histidine kinase [Saprospiraceae bacterium]